MKYQPGANGEKLPARDYNPDDSPGDARQQAADGYERGKVWVIRRDGEAVWQFACPGCGLRGDIDDDQLHGRESIDCPRCEFHETLTEAPKVIAGPMARAEEESEGG